MNELTEYHMKELSDFKLFLYTEGAGSKRLKRGARTIDLHLQTLKRLFKEAPELTLDQINSFFIKLIDKGRKGTYLNDFVDLLHIYGRFKKIDTFKELKYFPEEKFEAATMSDEEIEKFLKLPAPSTSRYNHKAKKNIVYVYGKGWGTWTMFWKLCAYHPVRMGEIAHLTVDDVDFGLGVLRVDGKTGKRTVPIHPVVLEDVKKFIMTLGTAQLFPSLRGGVHRQGGVIDDVDWGYNFHCRIKRLEIKRTNLRPYSLRHSSITRLLDNGVNPFIAMEMAGHKDLRTTLGYYHKTLKAKKEAIKKDPLGRTLMEFNTRAELFRELVMKGLEDLATTPEEKTKMMRLVRFDL